MPCRPTVKTETKSPQRSKIQKQSKCLSINEWISKIRYIHTMKYYSALIRKEISAICYTMDESWGHNAKWNCRHKRVYTAWFHLYEFLIEYRQSHRDKKSNGSCKGLGVEGSEELVFNGYSFSLKDFWRWMVMMVAWHFEGI